MKFWIARDKNKDLWVFNSKPIRTPVYFTNGVHSGCSLIISQDLFPEVTFENSPKQVELKLVINGKEK